MKKVLWILSSLALVGMGFVGCDDDDSSDACDGKCEDNQICAPIKGAAAECINADKILAKFKTADGKALLECIVIEKQANGDYTPVTDDTGSCTNYCYVNADCASKDCDTTTHTCKAAGQAKTDYKFVRIDDVTQNASGSDPGADIDAVVLVKGGASDANGAKKYAKQVKSYARGDGKSSAEGKIYAGDPDKILNAPDGLTSYGTKDGTCIYYANGSKNIGEETCDLDSKKHTGKTASGEDCDYNYTFVSLGGKGGYIIVEMEDKIEAGDKLDIVEIGDCKLSNTASGKTLDASAENMEVRISVSDDADSFKSLPIASNKASKGVLSINIADSMLK